MLHQKLGSQSGTLKQTNGRNCHRTSSENMQADKHLWPCLNSGPGRLRHLDPCTAWAKQAGQKGHDCSSLICTYEIFFKKATSKWVLYTESPEYELGMQPGGTGRPRNSEVLRAPVYTQPLLTPPL